MKYVKEILNYLLQIVLALLIVWAVLILVIVMMASVMELLMKTDSLSLIIYQIAIFGPWSIYTWLVLLGLLSGFVSMPAFFVFWVVKGSRKFRNLGIKTSPFLWAIGVALPTVIVVFPLYFIRRNITWPRKLSAANIKVQP